MNRCLTLKELSDLNLKMKNASRFKIKLIVSEDEAEFLKKFYFKGNLPQYVFVKNCKEGEALK